MRDPAHQTSAHAYSFVTKPPGGPVRNNTVRDRRRNPRLMPLAVLEIENWQHHHALQLQRETWLIFAHEHWHSICKICTTR